MEKCIRRIVRIINDNDGWTVIGWYKRGVINDQSIVGGDKPASSFAASKQPSSDAQVDNGPINYHVCYMTPTDQRFMNERNQDYGQTLIKMKYDVSRLQHA